MKRPPVGALLIGGGVAAVRCARALRRNGFGGTILLVGDEDAQPYNRPPLSKELLRDEVPLELVAAEPAEWYQRQAVELRTGVAVVRLDPEARTAELADGSRIRFETCLLATGAAPRVPPIPGAEHARLLRTITDAIALRHAAARGRRAVVIGGGFIGVEAAASLAHRCVEVTVLERTDALWGGLLGPELSEWAVARLTAAGVSVRLAASATAIEADGVVLDGERIPADLVLAGVGVSPRVDLAVAAGLAVDDGIVVDAGRETSAPGIFAAGDVAHPAGGPRVEHWHAAREGGEAAALGMLGRPVSAARAPWVFSEFAGAMLDVVGWAPTWDEIVVRGRVHAYVSGGLVTQLAVIDSAIPVEAARAFVERQPPIVELAELTARARG